MASELTAFLTFTKAKAVYLHVSKHRYGSTQKMNGSMQLVDGPIEEGGPIYRIEVAPPYVEYVENSRPSAWAEWQGHIILLELSDQLAPDEIYTLLNKSATNNLIKYARRIMPRQVTDPLPVDKHTNGKTREVRVAPPPPLFEGAFWEFKVIRGAAVFLNGHHLPH